MEEYKKIKNFSRYVVKNDGTIYSLSYRNKREIKELKLQKNNFGYLFTRLVNDEGIHKTVLVHRLVAEAFIDNPNKLDYVFHRDNNKSNNNIYNLEWTNNKSINENKKDREKFYNNQLKKLREGKNEVTTT